MNNEDIVKIIESHNLTYISRINNSYSKVVCIDKDGYRLIANIDNILSKSYKPIIFHKRNPYTIQNIQQWLNKTGSNTIITSTEYYSNKDCLHFVCGKCGKEFTATWNQMYTKKKVLCNFCSKSIRWDNYRDYYAEVITECEKYNYILLSTSISRACQSFDYICNKHRDKGVQTSSHKAMISNNRHCKYCGIESRGVKHRYDETHFKIVAENAGFIYCGVDYDNDNSKCKKANIHIMCPNHMEKGEQIVRESNLKKNKIGCAYCAGKYRTMDDLQAELDKANREIDILSYTEYVNPILLKCRICGFVWEAKPINLTQGHGGCPKHSYSSNFEKTVGDILDYLNMAYVPQYVFDDCKDMRCLPFDYYIPSINTLIEVDGEGHYIPIRRGASMTNEDANNNLLTTQRHDSIKNEYCEKNNINLIRIPYWERDNLYTYLSNKINATKNG